LKPRAPHAVRPRRETRPYSAFEFLPTSVFYAPVALYWSWLALRFRSISLPTAANPGIETGGLCGESKSGLLKQLGSRGRSLLAPWTALDAGRDDPVAVAAASGLRLPIVVKPDISCKGTAVRVVRDEGALRRTVAAFAPGVRVILQELITLEGEAGIFYVRPPGTERGRIVSLTLKYFPSVTGDGRSTLEQLVRADPRARRIAEVYLRRHAAHRHRVLDEGERFRLVFVGNHCRGAVFKDGRHLITPALEATIHDIAAEIPEFHVGRFDVRYGDAGDLALGRHLRIIELNGAGSEATHIWDARTRVLDAYATLFRQLRQIFEIGDANRRRGFRPMGWRALLGKYLQQRRLMRAYPSGE
jgi:hypothetical protein